MPPTVLHLSTYDANGGAARAAHSLHLAMVAAGLDSRMRVARKSTADPTVASGSDARFRLANRLDRQLWRLQSSPVRTWRSPARFGSISATEINRSGADVVNLHWVTDGFLSVEEIGRITKPVVWTMHDMWPFTGTEHYVPADDATHAPARWRTGYTPRNRPATEHLLDIDRMTWERKRRCWTRPPHLVPVSRWLGDLARDSALASTWPVTIVPNVMDTDTFTPVDKVEARAQLGLPDAPLIVFTSSAGVTDHRKGWQLLDDALPHVQRRHPDVEVIVIGPHQSGDHVRTSAPIHWQGQVNDNDRIRLLIGAADVAAVPSLADNLPMTALEAQTCGRPVVAFDIGGLPDIVDHQSTGYLARPFDAKDLALGLVQAIDDSRHEQNWSRAARARALATWSGDAVVPKYLDVYERALR